LAEIYLTSLDDKATPRAVRSTLSQFERQVPGSTETQRREVLDKAYHQAMDRITGQKPGFRNLALKALCWITCAARPLAPAELQHALAVEAGDSELDEDNIPRLERMVSICAGLVTIDEESHVIRLVHYTTQEFFQERWRDWFPTAHDEITDICITYLSFKDFETGMCKTYVEYNERLQLHSLYLYAIICLGQHIHKASARVKQKVIGFFGPGRNLEAAIQAWSVADRKPDEMRDSGDLFDPWCPNTRDALYLATCLGLEEVIQTLLEKRRSWPTGPTSKAVPLNDDGTAGYVDVAGGPLAPNLIEDGGEDAITTRFLKELGEQHQIGEMRTAGYTLLHMAAKNVKEEVAAHLLDQGSDIEARGRDGCTPLHLAAEVYAPAVVRLLLQTLTKPDHPTDAEEILIRLAAKKGADVTAKLLIDRGAGLDAVDSHGRTPLHLTARAGNEAVLKLLLLRGADIEAKDASGRTPLLMAVHRPLDHESEENLTVVNLLLDKGADVEARFSDGWTTLLVAVQYNLQSVSKLLLEKGADVKAQDNKGRTPLSIASELRSWDMVQLLRGWPGNRGAQSSELEGSA
jgi:ankyrin repeat protein